MLMYFFAGFSLTSPSFWPIPGFSCWFFITLQTSLL
jgi:hypothetical protein